jgi:hypothetical protein
MQIVLARRFPGEIWPRELQPSMQQQEMPLFNSRAYLTILRATLPFLSVFFYALLHNYGFAITRRMLVATFERV